MQTWLRPPGTGNSVDLRDSSVVLDQPHWQSPGLRRLNEPSGLTGMVWLPSQSYPKEHTRELKYSYTPCTCQSVVRVALQKDVNSQVLQAFHVVSADSSRQMTAHHHHHPHHTHTHTQQRLGAMCRKIEKEGSRVCEQRCIGFSHPTSPMQI